MLNLKETWLCVCILWQFFASVRKEEEKEKKMSNFLKAYISGDLLQIWYVFSPDMPAPAQQIWSCFVKRPQSYERV